MDAENRELRKTIRELKEKYEPQVLTEPKKTDEIDKDEAANEGEAKPQEKPKRGRPKKNIGTEEGKGHPVSENDKIVMKKIVQYSRF